MRDNVITGSRDAAGHPHHVAAQPVTVLICFTGNLFRRRDHTLRPLGLAAHPHDDKTTRVGPAVTLDHTGNDFALMGREFAVIALVLGVAESLQDHLPRGGGGDPPETLRRVIPLAEHVAVGVELLGDHPDRTGFSVDVDVRVLSDVPGCAGRR